MRSITMGGVTRNVASDCDAHGNRTRLTQPDGAFFEYAYDGADRLIHLSENGPSITLASLLYDPQGRRDQLARDAAGSITQYGYDPVSRLAALSHDLDGAGSANDAGFGFAYNPASQIVSRSLSNNAYEYPVASSTKSYAVNGRNQYTQVGGTTHAWDANGNLTSDGATSFGYDTENRLTSASGAKSATLTYDPLGRLYQVTSGGVTTRFLYDGYRLIAEYNTAGTVQRRYVHGAGVDEPLVWYEGSAVSAATRRYLHADHQGSIIATSNAAGAKQDLGSYDAYGVTTAPSTWRFQYTGQAAIPPLGLYYYKARFYNPALGRFMQTDPIGYDDDVNLYAYVKNDPLNHVDPTGLAVESPWDITNVGMGAVSLVGNIASGNVVGAVVDLAGLVYDLTATAVPGLPGGAGTAIKAARTADVVGTAQKTWRSGRIPTGHAFASARQAFGMLRSGSYSKVALNRELSTITGGEVASKLRPDVAGVRPDGKIDITEVLSPGQRAGDLQEKYSEALGERMGDFKAVETKKHVCTGSRIVRETPC